MYNIDSDNAFSSSFLTDVMFTNYLDTLIDHLCIHGKINLVDC